MPRPWASITFAENGGVGRTHAADHDPTSHRCAGHESACAHRGFISKWYLRYGALDAGHDWGLLCFVLFRLLDAALLKYMPIIAMLTRLDPAKRRRRNGPATIEPRERQKPAWGRDHWMLLAPVLFTARWRCW